MLSSWCPHTFGMSPPLNRNYLMLGAGNLKTLSISQPGWTIQTEKNGKLEHLVHHQETKKKHQVVKADFAKTKDFNSFPNRIIPGYINNQGEKMSKLGQAKDLFIISRSWQMTDSITNLLETYLWPHSIFLLYWRASLVWRKSKWDSGLWNQTAWRMSQFGP